MYLLQLLQGHNMEIEGRPVTVSRALARIPNDRRPADRNYDDRRDDHRYAMRTLYSCMLCIVAQRTSMCACVYVGGVFAAVVISSIHVLQRILSQSLHPDDSPEQSRILFCLIGHLCAANSHEHGCRQTATADEAVPTLP